jgi:hypothetical protein
MFQLQKLQKNVKILKFNTKFKDWNLAPNSTLRDVVLVVRADEAHHRDVNHEHSEKVAQTIE